MSEVKCKSCGRMRAPTAYGRNSRGESRVTCEECRIRIAGGEAAYTCKICQWGCRTTNGLSQHEAKVHFIRGLKSGAPLTPGQQSRVQALRARLARGGNIDTSGIFELMFGERKGAA